MFLLSFLSAVSKGRENVPGCEEDDVDDEEDMGRLGQATHFFVVANSSRDVNQPP